ncbi:MAG: M23 family metallopeptidase [Thermodesulfobacteria bacterium]|nr:M23 family metallopeptidase [Thermodesulfobacteriota bacterium]
MKRFLIAFFFLVLFGGASSVYALTYKPEKPFPGSPLLLEVPSGARKLLFLGKSFYPFSFKGKTFILAAIPLDTRPGLYRAELDGEEKLSFEIRIFPRRYPSERLTVPPKMIHYPPEVLARIKREVRLIRKTLAGFSPESLLDGPFVWPAAGRLSSPFGFRRIYNGVPKSPHSGLDIALPEGTPVKAANRGRVALTGDFYLNGKTVILDHGLGIYTIYCHLKKILVRRGELVEKGERLALSGKSGRVTGPHLHFGVYIRGVKVDPKVLLEVF